MVPELRILVPWVRFWRTLGPPRRITLWDDEQPTLHLGANLLIATLPVLGIPRGSQQPIPGTTQPRTLLAVRVASMPSITCVPSIALMAAGGGPAEGPGCGRVETFEDFKAFVNRCAKLGGAQGRTPGAHEAGAAYKSINTQDAALRRAPNQGGRRANAPAC